MRLFGRELRRVHPLSERKDSDGSNGIRDAERSAGKAHAEGSVADGVSVATVPFLSDHVSSDHASSDQAGAPQQREANAEAAVQIDAHLIVRTTTCPCAILARDGTLVDANPAGQRFVDAVLSDADSYRTFSIAIAESVLRPKVSHLRLDVPVRDDMPSGGEAGVDLEVVTGRQAAQVTLLPISVDGSGVLVLVNDLTFDKNLTSALSASRALYRDLVTCSSDFCWETDARGSFVFVNRQGALGYSAHELNGKPAESLITDRDRQSISETMKVFATPVALHDAEVCLQHKDGTANYYLMSAVPVFDAQGHWTGVRGAGRNVTELKSQQYAIEAAQIQRDVIHDIVQATRSNIDPQAIMDAAAQAVLKAFDVDYCAFFRIDNENRMIADAFTEACAGAHSDALSRLEKPQPHQMLAQIRHALSRDQLCAEFLAGPWRIIAQTTSFHNQANGIVVLGWLGEPDTPLDDVQPLLGEVAVHLGLTFAQVQHTMVLQELSRKDPLTDLLNRRAFLEDAENRLVNHRRHLRSAAMMCFDLDNFKTINDTCGHKAGDQVLTALAWALRSRVRANDLIVRFGGDEFGVLLEESTRDGAIAKANELISLCEDIQHSAGVNFDISFSIGIAMIDPNVEEPIESVLERADGALYDAKNRGKNCWSVSSDYSVPASGDTRKPGAKRGAQSC